MAELYLDHNVSNRLAPLLRATGHTVATSRTLNLMRATDDEQLEIAVQRGWVLLTHNEADFRLLHDAWRTWPTTIGAVLPPHPGILVLEDRRPEILAAVVAELLATSQARPLVGELYRWSRTSGWLRRLPRSGWTLI